MLSGHSHSYERSFLIDGHYGDSTTFIESMKVDGGDGNETGNGPYLKIPRGVTPYAGAGDGAVYTVAGSSGRITGGLLNHPAMFISMNVLGSVVLDIDDNRLDLAFLDHEGLVQDEFSIIKNCPDASVIASGAPKRSSSSG